jgi:hypothetical protein
VLGAVCSAPSSSCPSSTIIFANFFWLSQCTLRVCACPSPIRDARELVLLHGSTHALCEFLFCRRAFCYLGLFYVGLYFLLELIFIFIFFLRHAKREPDNIPGNIPKHTTTLPLHPPPNPPLRLRSRFLLVFALGLGLISSL